MQSRPPRDPGHGTSLTCARDRSTGMAGGEWLCAKRGVRPRPASARGARGLVIAAGWSVSGPVEIVEGRPS